MMALQIFMTVTSVTLHHENDALSQLIVAEPDRGRFFAVAVRL